MEQSFLKFGLVIILFIGAFAVFSLSDEFCEIYGKDKPRSLVMSFKFLVGVFYGLLCVNIVQEAFIQ